MSEQTEHERIWLEPKETGELRDEGRCWCQDNAWGDKATEYVRADLVRPQAGEAVAWTGSGSLAALAAGREGYIWPSRADAHPVPLFAAALAEKDRRIEALDSELNIEQMQVANGGEIITDLKAALSAAKEREQMLERTISACNWYWPEEDTSSEMCRDSAREVLEYTNAGEVCAVSRGGVVETRYYAWLPTADDATSDDEFEVDEASEQEAKAKIAAELSRRAALAVQSPAGPAEEVKS